MKKSNKISIIYILSSLSLLLVLIFGGVYGIYVSVGLNFVRSSVSNISNVAPNNAVSNVSLAGSVNFESSMTGVIILSIILIVIAVFDIISLIRQVVLFKQFKVINQSKLEHKIEKKVKSKGLVLFFAGLIDFIAFGVGVAGIFVNSKTFVGSNITWVLYLIDALVSIFALLSFILMIMKVKRMKKQKEKNDNQNKVFEDEQYFEDFDEKHRDGDFDDDCVKLMKTKNFDVDEIEYKLLKLKHLKTSKLISADEFENLRKSLFDFNKKVQTSEIKINESDNRK